MNEWIEWHGGECPVDGGVSVEILFYDSLCLVQATAKSADCKWNQQDIIAYRVVDSCATAQATS